MSALLKSGAAVGAGDDVLVLISAAVLGRKMKLAFGVHFVVFNTGWGALGANP